MSVEQYELPLPPPGDTDPTTQQQRALRVEEQGIIDRAFRILENRHWHSDPLASPDITRAYLRLKLAEEPNEVFGCLFLDNRHRVIKDEHLFFGTIDGASVHPRVVVQKALGYNAAALIVYHNHPSGVAEPSQADVRITHHLQEALKLVEVRLLDHIVVSVQGYASLAERGLM